MKSSFKIAFCIKNRDFQTILKYLIFKENAEFNYTIIFNIFVLLQFFGEVSFRVLFDCFNIFSKIMTNKLLVIISLLNLFGNLVFYNYLLKCLILKKRKE